jgi:hypothetical protein
LILKLLARDVGTAPRSIYLLKLLIKIVGNGLCIKFRRRNQMKKLTLNLLFIFMMGLPAQANSAGVPTKVVNAVTAKIEYRMASYLATKGYYGTALHLTVDCSKDGPQRLYCMGQARWDVDTYLGAWCYRPTWRRGAPAPDYGISNIRPVPCG